MRRSTSGGSPRDRVRLLAERDGGLPFEVVFRCAPVGDSSGCETAKGQDQGIETRWYRTLSIAFLDAPDAGLRDFVPFSFSFPGRRRLTRKEE